MKFFIIFACGLAVASAGNWAPLVVTGPQHLPVIGPNGVPIDTPAVQEARAAHLVHKAEAHARNGDVALVAHAEHLTYAHHAIAAPIVSAHVGIPETAEVVAAKHAHFAAHAEALARNGHIAPIHHILRRGILAPVAHAIPAAYPTTLGLPAVTSNGIPLETPEVVAAKSNHFAAHAEALSRTGHVHAVAAPLIAHAGLAAPLVAHAGLAAPALVAHASPAAYPTTIGVPAVTANGVPLETPEVVAAKSNHFAAHAEALTRTGHVHAVAAPLVAHAGIAAPALLAHASPAAYPTTIGVPAVTANGVPLETPEVVAAKSNHFVAHAEALARNSPIYSEAVIAAPVATVW